MRIALSGVSRHYGASLVLSNVTLSVPTEARIGIVGPNGVGKSTLLRLLAGVEEPDAGTVTREPAAIRVGYLPQEPDAREGESLLGLLSRRTGVTAAERELEAAATALAHDPQAAHAYEAALDRLVALGGGDLEARGARELAADKRQPGVQLDAESDLGRERPRSRLEVAAAECDQPVERSLVGVCGLRVVSKSRRSRLELALRGGHAGSPAEQAEQALTLARVRLLR